METTTVKLRFAKSERDGSPISFISKNPKSGKLNGVREDRHCKKSIVLVPKEIKDEVIFGVLYEAEVSQMKNGARGYVAKSLTPVTYPAEMEVIHVRKCLYQIKIVWGNQKVMFDPFDGRNPTMKDYNKIASYLKSRVDIADRDKFVSEFISEASKLKKKMSIDGCKLIRL